MRGVTQNTDQNLITWYSSSVDRIALGATHLNNENVKFGTQTGLITDLSSAHATSINTIREAFAAQKILERDARGGTRYTEILKSHFGVTSPDARASRKHVSADPAKEDLVCYEVISNSLSFAIEFI